MKLSIIITLYNRKFKIKKALDSLINQLNDNVEVIIVDDGSTDKPLDILENYINQYDNIHYFYQKNLGAAGAKNRGAKEAKGEFIAFLDSDDWLYDDECVSYILSKLNSKIDFYTCSSMLILKDNQENIVKINTCPKKIIERILKNPLSYAGLPLYIFRRLAFIDIGGFKEDHKWGDALLFWRKFFFKYRNIYILDKLIYVYDQRDANSVSRKKDNLFKDKVFYTINDSFSILEEKLILEKINKEWEITLLLLSISRKDFYNTFRYSKKILSNNFTKIPNGLWNVFINRIKK